MADLRTGTDTTVIAVPAPLSTTGGGTEATALRVTVATDSTGVVSVDDNAGSLTVDQATASNLNATVVNAGTFATQVDGAALTALQLLDDMIYTDDTSTHATGTSKGALMMAAAVPTDTSVNANDIAAVAMTTDRKLHVSVQDPLPASTLGIGNVGVIPRTSGGLTTYHLVSAATTNLVNVKNAAGQLFGWYVYNSNAAARKLCFHNSASAPTAGASIFFSLVVPPLSGTNVYFSMGIAFSSGISISTVTGLADNDTAAVALNDLIINLWYA